MQPSHLSTSLEHFSTYLSNPDLILILQSTRLSHLTDPSISHLVHKNAIKRLAKTYERICEEVRDVRNKYEAGNTLLGRQRPFGNMSALRQILGLEEGS